MKHTLVFKWGVSRGRDSYGYTTCYLHVDGRKVSGCNGGGYDMKGTALGHWVDRKFQDQLLMLTEPFYGLSFHDPLFDPSKAEIPKKDGMFGKETGETETVGEAEARGVSLGLDRYQQFYKASSPIPTERHRIPQIDGACGLREVEKILQALGYRLQYVHQSRSESIYTLHDFEGANGRRVEVK